MEMRLFIASDNNNTSRRVTTMQNSAGDDSNNNKCSRLKIQLRIVRAVDRLRFFIRFIYLLKFCNKFIGYSVVTWVSVVVLGGFVSDFSNQEFLRVSFLLLLQALYLAYNTSWPYIFTRLSDVALYFAGCGLPPGLPGAARFRFLRRAGGLVFFALTFSTSLVCVLFSTVVSRNQLPKHHVTASESYDAALKIFYVLLLINASVAYLQMWCSLPAWAGRSICSYFYRAVNSSQGKDYFRSREVELIDFVYDMMSDECRELIERGALYSLCLDMVPYVYHHPRGFEATLAAMESPNYYVQEAAILMVGFLVHLESHMPDAPRLLRVQEAIVRRLIDLGMGSGRTVVGPRKKAALWSLLMLAQHDLRALMRVSPFLQDLVEVVSTVLMDLGAHDSEIEDHDGLLPLLKILNAVLQDEESRVRFTTQQALPLLSEPGIEKLRQITSSEHEFRPASQMEKAATLTLTLLQNAPVPPHDTEADLQDELADPQSAGLKTKLWIVLSLYICTIGLALVLNNKVTAVYDAILAT